MPVETAVKSLESRNAMLQVFFFFWSINRCLWSIEKTGRRENLLQNVRMSIIRMIDYYSNLKWIMYILKILYNKCVLYLYFIYFKYSSLISRLRKNLTCTHVFIRIHEQWKKRMVLKLNDKLNIIYKMKLHVIY